MGESAVLWGLHSSSGKLIEHELFWGCSSSSSSSTTSTGRSYPRDAEERSKRCSLRFFPDCVCGLLCIPEVRKPCQKKDFACNDAEQQFLPPGRQSDPCCGVAQKKTE